MLLSVLAIALTLLAQARNEKTVSICGLSFKATTGWVATTERQYPAAEEACTGTLKSPFYDKRFAEGQSEHFDRMFIQVYRESLDETRERWEIRREGDRWLMGEGAMKSAAYEIKGPGWTGLRFDSIVMRAYSKDRYVGISSAVLIVISSTATERTAVVIVGYRADDIPLQLFLKSVRFDRR